MLEALPAAPATVVDAGGGTGQLAVALAGHGYRVTVVDTSAAMLATCAQRAADEGGEVAERVTGVQGDAADLPGLLGEDSQDAAVCHDLLTRVDDQAALLASLAGVLAEGGVLSLGFANRDWLALRAGRRGDHTGALRLVDGGGTARGSTLTEAEQLLAQGGPRAGGRLRGRGVRRGRRRRPGPGRAGRAGRAGAAGGRARALPVERPDPAPGCPARGISS